MSASDERRERVAVVISLTELGYPKPSWDDAKAIVRTLNRDAATIIFSQFNLFLSIASMQSFQENDLGIRRWAQERIISNIISVERLRELQQTLSNADLAVRILVHRSFSMAALRLVALYALPEDGNKLQDRKDFDVIGELALIINSLTEPDASELSPCDLAAQMAPSREIENHPDLGRTMVRMEKILRIFLHQRAMQPTESEIARHAEQVFAFVTQGFNFESFRDLSFALLSYYWLLDLPSVLKDQGNTYFNPRRPDHIIRTEILERYLSLISVDVADAPAYWSRGASDDRLLTDFSAFREKPFIKFGDESYLCIDPAFLMEKLAEGTYSWILNGLDAGRVRQFGALWGYLFEDYVDHLLDYAYEGREQQLTKHPYYENPQEEAFDGLVLEGTEMVAIECKSAFLSIDSRYSGKCRPFFDGLNEKFGDAPGAAVFQLLRNLGFIFGPRDNRKIRNLDLGHVRVVYPLVIVQEPMLEFWLTAKLMVDLFVTTARQVAWSSVRVHPVVFITIDEFESLTEHLHRRDFSLSDFLGAKLATDPSHKLSVSQYLYLRCLPEMGLKARPNQLMGKELDEFKAAWLARMKDAYR